MLADALNQCFLATTTLNDELSGEILELQKLDNFFYGQFRFTLKNVTVNRKHYDKYYCYIDATVIGMNPNVYLIVAIIPSEDPTTRGEDFQWVADWYRKFAILVDP